jgi:2,3-bisphosphoglycerate-dependent phosphoglycerate mutase
VAQSQRNDVLVIGSHGTWIARLLLGLGFAVDADFWFAMPMPAIYVVSEGGVVRGPGLPTA